jgi:hypothetical protein
MPPLAATPLGERVDSARMGRHPGQAGADAHKGHPAARMQEGVAGQY